MEIQNAVDWEQVSVGTHSSFGLGSERVLGKVVCIVRSGKRGTPGRNNKFIFELENGLGDITLQIQDGRMAIDRSANFSDVKYP